MSKEQLKQLPFISTSLNPVPNAKVCVYWTIHFTKLQLQTTFPKTLYVLVCLRALCGEYMFGFFLLILISKSWGCLPRGQACLFLDSDTYTERELFISARVFFPCMMPSMDG